MKPSICSGFPIATGEQWIQPRVWTSQLRRQDAYFSLVTLQRTPLLAAAEAGRFEVGWLRIRWSSLNPVNPKISIFSRHLNSGNSLTVWPFHPWQSWTWDQTGNHGNLNIPQLGQDHLLGEPLKHLEGLEVMLKFHWRTCTKRYEHVDIWDQLAQPG